MLRSRIAPLAILCVVAVSAFAQQAPNTPPPVPRSHGADRRASIAAATGNSAAAPPVDLAKVPMNQPVITLKGGCQPIGNLQPSKDCVRIITREQFEILANALQSDMAPEAKRSFAQNYGRLLIFADAARALGLNDDPGTQAVIQFMMQRVLADAVSRHYSKEFSHPSEAQIEAYYKQNSSKYIETTLDRIIIPRVPGTTDKPQPTEEQAMAAAQKLRQRWVAGEDPATLQQAAYEAAGISGAGTPDVKLGPRRPGSLPPNQEVVFQLKPGEVSEIYSDPAAYYVYKVESFRQIPISEVHDSISKLLQQQGLQDKMEEIGKSATPELNEDYFGPAGNGPESSPTGTPKTSNSPN